jgi:hypothetical protein
VALLARAERFCIDDLVAGGPTSIWIGREGFPADYQSWLANVDVRSIRESVHRPDCGLNPSEHPCVAFRPESNSSADESSRLQTNYLESIMTVRYCSNSFFVCRLLGEMARRHWK